MGNINRLFVAKTENGILQFFRYGLVATLALIIDLGVLVLLVEIIKLNYLIAASISFGLGLIANYLLSVYWVFHSSKFDDRKREFLLFSAIGLIGLVLNDVSIWFFTARIGLFYVASKLISVIIVFFWNFFMRKCLIFN